MIEFDARAAAAVLAVVALLSLLALSVLRRPRAHHIPVTEAKLDAIKERLEELERKQNQNDHDVRNIRAVLQAMPTERSVSDLREQIAGLAGRCEGMHDTLATNGYSLRRIEDYLLNPHVDKVKGSG